MVFTFIHNNLHVCLFDAFRDSRDSAGHPSARPPERQNIVNTFPNWALARMNLNFSDE